MRRRGITLMELIIAMVITFMVAMFLLPMFLGGKQWFQRARELSTCTQLLQATVEPLMGTRASSVPTGHATLSPPYDRYQSDISVTAINPQFSLLTVTITSPMGAQQSLNAMLQNSPPGPGTPVYPLVPLLVTAPNNWLTTVYPVVATRLVGDPSHFASAMGGDRDIVWRNDDHVYDGTTHDAGTRTRVAVILAMQQEQHILYDVDRQLLVTPDSHGRLRVVMTLAQLLAPMPAVLNENTPIMTVGAYVDAQMASLGI